MPNAEEPAIDLPRYVVERRPAEADALGRAIGFHPANRRLLLVGSLGCGLALLASLAAATVVWRMAQEWAWSDAGDAAFLLVFGPLIGFPAYGLVQLLLATRRWVVIHEHGFVWFDGAEAAAIPWKDVEAIVETEVAADRDGVFKGANHALRLQLGDDWTCTLDRRYADIETLARVVRDRYHAARLPEFLATLEAGGRVAFRPLVVTSWGLETTARSLNSASVECVALEGRRLAVYEVGRPDRPWFQSSVAEFPNAGLFLAVVAERGLAVRS